MEITNAGLASNGPVFWQLKIWNMYLVEQRYETDTFCAGNEITSTLYIFVLIFQIML